MKSTSMHAILDAAVTVYLRRGARGFSMRSVGAEAGITATAIYSHFPDKAALVQGLVDRARQVLGTHLLDGISGTDSLQRLWSCAGSYVRYACDYPQFYRLLFMESFEDVVPDVHEMQSGSDAAPFQFMIDRMREAMADGYLAEGDPAEAALAAWAHIHGLCTLALVGRIPLEDLEAICEKNLTYLLEGLKGKESNGL